MKGKKILITGGTGFIGANLIRRLVDSGHYPTLLIRKESNLWRIKEIRNEINIVETDLLNEERLSKDLAKIKADYIYHLAVYGANQSIHKEIKELLKFNILGSYNLINISSQLGFKYFINAGSSSEYGIKNNPMEELDLIRPDNFYGISKSAVTFMTDLFSNKYNLPMATLRVFSPYGYFEDHNRFVGKLMISIIKDRMVGLSRPNYVRDFIFIEDLVDGFMHFLNEKKYYGEIFNIGSGKQTKIGDFVRMTEKISGKKLKVKWSQHESNQVEPVKWEADITKAQSMLKWGPKIPLEKGIKKTYDWFIQNSHLYN